MTRTLALIAALSLPATANEPIRVYIDGTQIGTVAEFDYRPGQSDIRITTNEQVYGCQQARIFRDRFEI